RSAVVSEAQRLRRRVKSWLGWALSVPGSVTDSLEDLEWDFGDAMSDLRSRIVYEAKRVRKRLDDWLGWAFNVSPGVGFVGDLASSFDNLGQGVRGAARYVRRWVKWMRDGVNNRLKDIVRYITRTFIPTFKYDIRQAAWDAYNFFKTPLQRMKNRIADLVEELEDLADLSFGEIIIRTAGSVIPGFQSGGDVERGGVVRVHRGERIVPAAQVDRASAQDGGGSGARMNRFAEDTLRVQFEPRNFERFLSATIENGPANTGRGAGRR
ncbi:MAG: hypothetical protein R3324_10435, partial [Halobacteriales archaeon]|nr:hypothetical protein [Halobacteriales archaeon]